MFVRKPAETYFKFTDQEVDVLLNAIEDMIEYCEQEYDDDVKPKRVVVCESLRNQFLEAIGSRRKGDLYIEKP